MPSHYAHYRLGRQVRLELAPDDAEVVFTDQDTRLSKTVSAEELKTISSVITWRSKNGAPGTAQPGDESGTDLDLT